jgi:hypothetical protein
VSVVGGRVRASHFLKGRNMGELILPLPDGGHVVYPDEIREPVHDPNGPMIRIDNGKVDLTFYEDGPPRVRGERDSTTG